MAEQEQSLQTFLKWATDLGINDSPLPKSDIQSSSSCLGQSLNISHFPEAGGRGLSAARNLRKNELILRVPKSALITSQTLISKDPNLETCISKCTHLSSTQVLSVCLLGEMSKGKKSWWYPYLMQIPRYYDVLAMFTEFETKALQVDDAIWVTERVVSKAKSDWEQAVPVMKELNFRAQLMSFKWWLWALATVSSRTMHVPWDDAGCLCPVGDFFNYDAPSDESFHSEEDEESRDLQSNTHGKKDAKGKVEIDDRLTDARYEESVDAYCFYARKNYRKGEQVLLSYGTYTNLELLEHYGFHLNTNPNEKAFIPLESGIYSDSWPRDSLYLQWDGVPSFSLLSALRLWATPQNQRKSVSHLAYSGSQLSVKNEIVVMKWLVANCQSLLEKFPTSIEQDILLLDVVEKLLNCPSHMVEEMLLGYGDEIDALCEGNKLLIELSRKGRRSLERWRLAVQWRLRYKQILVDCMTHCNETIDVLSFERLSCQS
ncbi:[histone H3]-lysine(4) N-trimethyltransferase [Ranunculus cassubicifolius]